MENFTEESQLMIENNENDPFMIKTYQLQVFST